MNMTRIVLVLRNWGENWILPACVVAGNDPEADAGGASSCRILD